MMLSAAGMSLVGLFAKFGIRDLTLSSLMFWRYAATSFLLFLWLLLFGRLEGFFDFRHLKIQLLRTFFVLLSQYCFFYYLIQNSLLNAAALLNTGPVFIAVIEWGILRKKVGRSSWIGALIAFIGALFILQPDAGVFSLTSFIGLLSGMSQGASQVVFGLHSEKEEKPQMGVMHLFALCTLLSLIPFLFFHTEMESGRSFTFWDVGVILALGAASAVNQVFRAEAYAHGTPSRLSPYLYFAVLLGGVYDWAIFGKEPNSLAVLGAALIVFGGLLKMYLRSKILKNQSHYTEKY
jgi:drug/metabolite transporter (DMT)-like permease